MIAISAQMEAGSTVVRRLRALGPLDQAAVRMLAKATQKSRTVPAHHEILVEGKPIGEPYLILDGWAARVRILADGRRQILGLLLPEDLAGHCYQARPLAVSSIVTLTDVELCPAPPSDTNASLCQAYAVSHALDEAHLLAQITRLGRMNAYERLADLFLELLERLSLAGRAVGNRFAHPLTQELVADVTGLTTVHVNRTLRAMRRDGEANWGAGHLELLDPAGLSARIGRGPTKVTSRRT